MAESTRGAFLGAAPLTRGAKAMMASLSFALDF